MEKQDQVLVFIVTFADVQGRKGLLPTLSLRLESLPE